MLRKGCTRYGNTQKDVSFSDAADCLNFKHWWFVASITRRQHVLHTDRIAVWTQFEFLSQKAGEKALYANSAVLFGVIVWASYQHGINFL
ncbi:hypothetical protein [Acinetobacter variabilis]|uniref:hypothetical protein n=1 Tax=Acinetobacter variabilis TaxID=70346 RepID=UPI003AF624D1